MKISLVSRIEALEPRIAPAVIASFALAATGKSATYTDIDGDLVKIKISKGKFIESDFIFGGDDTLATLHLTRVDGKFSKTNLTITATPPAGSWSDGLVHVGQINAAGIDLGKVKVDGNSWSIKAGDSDAATTGLQSLSVDSLGREPATPGTAEDYYTAILGKLGKLTVKHDLVNAEVEVTGGAAGSIGKVTIGGSLLGGNDEDSGSIYASGNIGAVKIGGSISGGAGADSGRIATGSAPVGGSIKSVTVGMSLIGGTGPQSGEIGSDTKIGFIKINQNIEGGLIDVAGVLNPSNAQQAVALGSLIVKGNVTNATIAIGYTSAGDPLQADVSLGKVLVKGNWAASNLVVGVGDSTSDGFGRNDHLIDNGDLAAIVAKIGSITINGTASGSATPTDDFFGITAEQIGKATITGNKLDVSGTADLLLDSTNNDFRLVEVGLFSVC